jgi:hypothetical protein
MGDRTIEIFCSLSASDEHDVVIIRFFHLIKLNVKLHPCAEHAYGDFARG